MLLLLVHLHAAKESRNVRVAPGTNSMSGVVYIKGGCIAAVGHVAQLVRTLAQLTTINSSWQPAAVVSCAAPMQLIVEAFTFCSLHSTVVLHQRWVTTDAAGCLVAPLCTNTHLLLPAA
jgi:hypothetical protein